MNSDKEKIKIVTHDGGFHADDVFACATLEIFLENKGEKYEVIRTRDYDVIKTGDYVFDIGGVYDVENGRFDHHQRGGAGARDNGIGYAAFGLVWKEFGEKICGSKDIALKIDHSLVAAIDANDVGIDMIKPLFKDYGFPSIVKLAMEEKPTWKEDKGKEAVFSAFNRAVDTAKKLMKRMIQTTADSLEAQKIILDTYNNSTQKEFVVFDTDYARYNFNYVLSSLPEIIYFVYPDSKNESWKAECVHKEKDSFEPRKPFPADWAGLREAELASITGVSDVLFCHNGKFLCVTKTREGAIALAKLALEN